MRAARRRRASRPSSATSPSSSTRRRPAADGRRRRSGRTPAPLLQALDLFDIYRGRPLADAEKSLAWRLTFGSDERTLTESEVDDAMAAVAAGLATDVGGRLRS